MTDWQKAILVGATISLTLSIVERLSERRKVYKIVKRDLQEIIDECDREFLAITKAGIEMDKRIETQVYESEDDLMTDLAFERIIARYEE